MAVQLRIYEYVSQKPNGDRDTQTHPSSEFKVVLINGGRKKTVFKNNQFDPFWTHINGTREEYHQEARDFAESLAQTLGTVEVVDVDKTNQEVEAELLERRIKNDTERLEKLKAKTRSY